MRECMRSNFCFLICLRLNFKMSSKDKEVGQAKNFHTFKATTDQFEHFYAVLNSCRDNMERQPREIEELRQVSINNTSNTSK